MDISDKVALKIHGYVFSDSDTESSSDDDVNDSVEISNTQVRPRSRTPLVTDSDQSSGLSDFDDDYYAIQPPPILIKNFKGRIVKIEAINTQKNEQNPKTVFNNVWKTCLQSNKANDFDCSEVEEVNSSYKKESKINPSSLTSSTKEFFYLPNYLEDFPPVPHFNKRKQTSSSDIHNDTSTNTYTFTLQDFPSLPEPKKNTGKSATGSVLSALASRAIPCYSETAKNVEDYKCPQIFQDILESPKNSRISIKNTKAKKTKTSSSCTNRTFSCNLETSKSIKLEFQSGCQLNKNKTVESINTSSPGTIKKSSHFPMSSENSFGYSSVSVSTPNKNRRVIKRPSTGSGKILEDLQELKFLPQSNQKSKVRNPNTSTSKQVSSLSDVSACIAVEFLPHREPIENVATNPKTTLLEGSFVEKEELDDILALTHNHDGLAFPEAELIKQQKTMIIKRNCDIDPKNSLIKQEKSIKKKNKLNKLEPEKDGEKLNIQKLIINEAEPIMKIKHKKAKNIQPYLKQLQNITRDRNKKESKPEPSKIQYYTNYNAHKSSLNKNLRVLPKTTKFENKTYCDTRKLANDNLNISVKKVPDFVRHQLVRYNNANWARVRLAGERKRRRVHTRLNRLTNNNLAKQAFVKRTILLFTISFLFYNLTSFLTMYIENIFGICDSDEINRIL